MNAGRVIALAAAVGFVTPVALSGQDFGRNKVQYESFQFQVLRTEHFQVYFYPEEREAAQQAGRLAERWYARYAALLGHQLRGAQPLVLYASHPDFEQTNVVSGELDEGTGGVTESLKRRIVLPLAGPLAETDHVIGHELVHAFQYDITGTGRGGVTGAADRLPLWFIEGMAEYLSLGPVDPNTAMWLRDAVRHNKIPSIRQLEDPRYFPYRWGQAFWAYLTSRYGDGAVATLLKSAGKSGNVTVALEQISGEKLDSLSHQWQAAVRAAYAPVASATAAPEAFGKPLSGEKRGAQLNVAPALSPDGSRIAYFSERGLFSIELYLADVASGRVERTLTHTALDPHYESVGFISSAGAWDATGQRFAFGVVEHGRPVLSILDVNTGKAEREVPFPALGQILNTTWAPDGHAVAFSAQANGWTDLYVYDLQRNDLQRLTNDGYADLQPAWSPDGRSLAFVTDRFTTDTTDLAAGPYRLALLDVTTRAIRPLPAFAGAKHINPQWSPDGASLYFVSDRGGIDNVYRLQLASGTTTQVTNLFVGASGITAVSPVISVAQRTGELVFTAYDSTGYRLFAMKDPAMLAGKPLATLPVADAGALPLLSRAPSDVAAKLADTRTGLPPVGTGRITNYHAGLSLDYVAQPYLAVATSSFGTFVGGGATLVWSDMLGDHSLITGLQVNGGLKDVGAVVAYINQHRRLNWGIAAQQVPYRYGNFAAGFGTVNGQPAYIEETLLFRQTNRTATGFLTYPLSRVQRVEFSAGFENISFDQELRIRAFDPTGSVQFFDSTQSLPAPGALNLGVAGAALVHDNSYFGATSPILGSRYRFEVDPTIGSLKMATILADYRRYVMPVRKLTLAGRVVHAGRYGPDAQDARLTPLYIGYQQLVRGYDIGSFSASECPSTGGACPAFDRLLGSRILVGNVEARFPLLGVLGVGSGYYGALPIEGAVFADAGVAWNKADQHSLFDVRRQGVTSVGAALRMNLFGFAVAELDYVKPFQRPDKGWYWELSLTPGF
ncbi:MAG TPA: BamA/TamA family outer membrane protein [Gemmatimonadales bacterium]|nr:BamA/TamA family outer membrane protein [Gemmatimonadales bacterium]